MNFKIIAIAWIERFNKTNNSRLADTNIKFFKYYPRITRKNVEIKFAAEQKCN